MYHEAKLFRKNRRNAKENRGKGRLNFMKIAVVQTEPKLNELKYNLSKILKTIEKIMTENEDTNLILLPELATTGYECGKRFYDFAEVMGKGACFTAISELAKKYHVNIVYGFPEEDPVIKGVLYNSAGVIDSNGTAVGTYRKVHLFAGEKNYFRPGSEYPVFNLYIGKIGIMICLDTLFPEVARCLAVQGADLLLVSTNWEKPYDAEWDFMTSARAFDNTLHLAAANRIGHDIDLGFFGHSRILDPLGKPIQTLDAEEEGVLHAEIDLNETRKLRSEYWTQLTERRSDTFGLLVKDPY
jgi:predicted amidohydrolase